MEKEQGIATKALGRLPEVPKGYRHYLEHSKQGVALREIARREGVAASTVLRQIRRVETKRDDPLLDTALESLGRVMDAPKDGVAGNLNKAAPRLTGKLDHIADVVAQQVVPQVEILRVLRRLAEPGAKLISAPDMERALIMRGREDQPLVRTAVIERSLAESFVLREWIVLTQAGRPAVYELTAIGRAALRRLLAELGESAEPEADAGQIFAA